MNVLALLKEIHVGLPAYHQVMAAVEGTHTACVELVCITYENTFKLASHHRGDRNSRAVGNSCIEKGLIILIGTPDRQVCPEKIHIALHENAWLYR